MKLMIRPACQRDAKFLLELRNDPLTREKSFQSELISWEQHCVWYEKKLKNPLTRLYILENETAQPVGQVRFEKLNAEIAEVSLAISSVFRGKGFGKDMLKQALAIAPKELSVVKIQALVKTDNEASLRLFQACGFVLHETFMLENNSVVKLMWET